MKRSLIALGVAAAVALPVVANAAPTLYGKLNLTLDRVSDDTIGKDFWQVNSNASRLGVMGDEKLTDSISGIYQIEYEVNGVGSTAPVGGSTDLAARNRFAGLKFADVGSLKLGRFDTYVKAIGVNVDPFVDQIADHSTVIGGKDRISNVIGFESANFAGITFNVMVQPGEAKASQPAAANTKYDNGLADAVSASVNYANNDIGLKLAAGYNKNVMSKFAAFNGASAGVPTISSTTTYVPADTAATARTDITRLAGSYTIAPAKLTVNAMYQMATRGEDYTYTYNAISTATPVKPEEKGWLLSATWGFAEGWTGKAEYASSTTDFKDANLKNIDINMAELGVDYNFTKSTKVFALLADVETKNKNNPSTATNGVTDSVKRNYTSLGIEQKF